MSNVRILWADDEIDLLRSQIKYLSDKGYDVIEVTNATDALEKCADEPLDIVFLDENMPGLSGLDALQRIKQINPQLPVVMITKNEEENLMEEAIGSQITDYLIKPVKPQQILLTLKKIMDNKRLVKAKTDSTYQQEFQKIFMAFQEKLSPQEWSDLYRKLVYWELTLERSGTQMSDVFDLQKEEANREFSKFVSANYLKWLRGDSAPTMSHTLMAEKVLPHIGDGPVMMVLVDNLRFDQWKAIEPLVAEHFRVISEEVYYSILPTATQYSRNAIFAGMHPLEIEKRFPKQWRNDEEEGGKNMFENEFLTDLMVRNKVKGKYTYQKILNLEEGQRFQDEVHNYLSFEFSAIVYNFVDMLSHARTDMQVLKELANDEAAYRSLTLSWFEHSPLFAALKRIADKKVKLIITTDHGSVRVKTPSKVVGDRNTTTNLRYKTGKNLSYDKRDVLEVKNPHDAFLPKQHVSSSFIFVRDDKYFVYPNNYSYYAGFYKNTFQHGGISLEEMLIPLVVLTSK